MSKVDHSARSELHLLPPPLRGRVGEGGKQSRRRLEITPLPTGLRPLDLPLKGGGEVCFGGGP
jgi:hypothetical protein